MLPYMAYMDPMGIILLYAIIVGSTHVDHLTGSPVPGSARNGAGEPFWALPPLSTDRGCTVRLCGTGGAGGHSSS